MDLFFLCLPRCPLPSLEIAVRRTGLPPDPTLQTTAATTTSHPFHPQHGRPSDCRRGQVSCRDGTQWHRLVPQIRTLQTKFETRRGTEEGRPPWIPYRSPMSGRRPISPRPAVPPLPQVAARALETYSTSQIDFGKTRSPLFPIMDHRALQVLVRRRLNHLRYDQHRIPHAKRVIRQRNTSVVWKRAFPKAVLPVFLLSRTTSSIKQR